MNLNENLSLLWTNDEVRKCLMGGFYGYLSLFINGSGNRKEMR